MRTLQETRLSNFGPLTAALPNLRRRKSRKKPIQPMTTSHWELPNEPVFEARKWKVVQKKKQYPHPKRKWLRARESRRKMVLALKPQNRKRAAEQKRANLAVSLQRRRRQGRRTRKRKNKKRSSDGGRITQKPMVTAVSSGRLWNIMVLYFLHHTNPFPRTSR